MALLHLCLLLILPVLHLLSGPAEVLAAFLLLRATPQAAVPSNSALSFLCGSPNKEVSPRCLSSVTHAQRFSMGAPRPGPPSLLHTLENELRKAEALLQEQEPSTEAGPLPQGPLQAPPPPDWIEQQQRAFAQIAEEGPPKGEAQPEVDDRLKMLLERAAEGPGDGGPHLIDVRRQGVGSPSRVPHSLKGGPCPNPRGLFLSVAAKHVPLCRLSAGLPLLLLMVG